MKPLFYVEKKRKHTVIHPEILISIVMNHTTNLEVLIQTDRKDGRGSTRQIIYAKNFNLSQHPTTKNTNLHTFTFLLLS
jgi:hypothetical protein